MSLPFVKARWFTPVTGKRRVTLIVLHSMEAPEKGTTAESVANYFARGTVKASAHVCIDADSAVKCVRDNNVAYAAPGANHNGYQVEHAGYARQTREQWLDDYSKKMLRRSARHAAAKCKKWNIPAVFVDRHGLVAGKKGITTHAEVTAAFKQSTHTDPGRGFPMDVYLGMVQTELMPRTHVVKEGDTIAGIAKMYDMRPGKLWRLNRANIFTGERLKIR